MNEGEEAIHRQRVQRQTKQDIGRKKNQMRGAPYLEETDQAGYSEVENQNVERETLWHSCMMLFKSTERINLKGAQYNYKGCNRFGEVGRGWSVGYTKKKKEGCVSVAVECKPGQSAILCFVTQVKLVI